MPKNKKELIKFYLLSFTWGILHTLVGLFVLLFVVLFLRKQVDIFMIKGRIAVNFKDKIFGGVSLGIVYLAGTRFRKTHMHELGHTIQNIWWGPLFLPVIGIPSIIRAAFWPLIRKRYYNKYGTYPSYDRIWFEGQATRLGIKHFEKEVNEALERRGL